MLNDNAKNLIDELSQISKRGPLKGVGSGPPSVGMTLLAELKIPYESKMKPRKNGIVVSARRGSKSADPHRVNLFAQVPNWKISECKSSAEILRRFGYVRDGDLKLNCTVRSSEPNPQGLILEVDGTASRLHECFAADGQTKRFASWDFSVLEQRLIDNHPETIWVTATAEKRGDGEYFHYRQAVYSDGSRSELLPELIKEGSVTLDHVITKKNGRVTEKGPLFKIKPKNLQLLFPELKSYDLMSM